MSILKGLLSLLGLVAVSYLVVGVILTLLPVNRKPAMAGFDFEQLEALEVLDGSVVEAKRYAARDGEQLHFLEFAGSDQAVLILIHGSGAEGRYLQPLADTLRLRADYTVIVPDLRGHGRSAGADQGDVDYLGQIEDDVGDLVRLLRTRFPDATVVLGGHSSGGGFAIRYGGNANNPPVDGLLLLAPYLGRTASTVRPDSGGWVQVSVRRYIGLQMLNAAGITALNATPVLFFNRPAEWDDPLQTDDYSFRLNESLPPRNLQQDLEGNPRDMLVLVGSEDEAFYAEEFAPIFARHAKNASVVVVEGATHFDLLYEGTAIERMAAWLTSIIDRRDG